MAKRALLVLVAGVGSIVSALAAVPAASASSPSARLVRVDVFQPAANAGHGRGGPPAATTANCSPAGATYGEYAVTGWVTESTSATLVTSSIPATIRTGASSAAGATAAASASAVLAAMQGAFTAWHRSDARAPDITVTADATSTQRKQIADRTDELLFGRVSGNAIAVTYTWQWQDGLTESDTVFSDRLGWAIIPDDTPSAGGCYLNWPWYDVQDIATHEFGHTYGLGHAQTDRFETMYVYGYTGETLKRSPADGDDAGMSDLY
jgi:hypothetical protein